MFLYFKSAKLIEKKSINFRPSENFTVFIVNNFKVV